MSENLIKVAKIHPDAKLPEKADGNMCYDVFSVEEKEVSFGEVVVVKTGIKVEPPKGYHYSVRPRSGHAAKDGIGILAGQIDNSYRGELLICLTKHKDERDLTLFDNSRIPFNIHVGMKIAQIKFEKDETFDVVEVKQEDLSETSRGSGKFGSTGN